MKRGITRKKSDELVDKIRQTVPEIALRTTLISGFPGETIQDHEEMLKWVGSTRFDRLGVFPYSHEENTSAYSLKDDVPEEEKSRRAEEIMDLQAGISFELNHEKVGKSYKVLFDRVEDDYFVGRTEFDSPEVDNEVLVSKKDNFVRIGDFADVKIIKADNFDLYGILNK